MEKLRILLRSGVTKRFPLENVAFRITEGYIKVWEVNSKPDNFLFVAPMSNVEYAERITITDESK